jgi:hypothetical protein
VIASAPPTLSEPTGAPALTAFLSALSHQELVALMLDMARRFPELRNALAVHQMLASYDADQLEAEVLGRIIVAGAASGWGDRWDDEAHCRTTARSTMGSSCYSTRATPMRSCGSAKSCSRRASARSSRPTTTARLRRRSPPVSRSSFGLCRARRSRRAGAGRRLSRCTKNAGHYVY